MSLILDACVVGDLVVAMGDGTGDPLDPLVGLPLINPPAWVVGNVGPLWVRGAKRGSDVLMPGAVGVRPFRRRPTVMTHSLSFVVSGDYDATTFDDCPDDPWVALEHNLAFLDENLTKDPGTRAGVRNSVLTMPSGEQRFAAPHWLRMTPARVESAQFVGTLEISIPENWYHLPAESPS